MSEGDPQQAPVEAPAEQGAGAPEGSAYEEEHARRRSRSAKRRIKGWLSRLLVGLVAWIFPYLYYAYCWLVWKTSRFEDHLTENLEGSYARHDCFVTLLWHQEVFTVAYAFRHLNGHTVASTGNFGRIITRMLELCNFTVFRGGSSKGKSRKRGNVLRDMIRHLRRTRLVGYGITVDGSRGPRFHMKKGGAVIARTGRAPIYLVRTWFSRRILLPTWDRTTFPLPLGRIVTYAVGPYWIPRDCSEEEFERICQHLEQEMLELTEYCYRRFEAPHSKPRWREGFPEGWQPRWAPGQLGIPLGPHDLRPEDPPEWATRPPEANPAETPT